MKPLTSQPSTSQSSTSQSLTEAALLLSPFPRPPLEFAWRVMRCGSMVHYFPSLASLAAQCIARDASTLERIARDHRLHLLTPTLRTQLLGTLAANGVLNDELLECLLGGAVELNLSECVQVTSRGMAAVAKNGAELCRLCLTGLSISDEALSLVGMHCARLAVLHLGRCRRLTNECVALLAQQLALTDLDLSQCRQLGDMAAESVLRHSPQLVTLRLDGTRVSDALLDSIPGMAEVQGQLTTGFELPGLRGLTALSLQGCRQLSESALQRLCYLTPLLILLRMGATAAGDSTVEAISESLPRLRALSLEGCSAVSDRALPLLLLGCPALAALDLGRCALIGTVQFHHSSHSLRELQLSHCTALSRSAFVTIAESCEALSALWLEGCSALDDQLVFELCQGCAALERLSLAHCHAVTERALFYIAMLRQIMQLCVCGCVQIQDGEALAALSMCTSLLVLELPSRRVIWAPTAATPLEVRGSM